MMTEEVVITEDNYLGKSFVVERPQSFFQIVFIHEIEKTLGSFNSFLCKWFRVSEVNVDVHRALDKN